MGGSRAYKVVDPSFHNWFGLALALRDQEISDFPLCNKSFNLSYAATTCDASGVPERNRVEIEDVQRFTAIEEVVA